MLPPFVRVSPATKWPERIVWYDRNVSLENFVLTLGESQLGPVTVDLRTNAHILLGGVTGSGKTVLLKVLLRQAWILFGLSTVW